MRDSLLTLHRLVPRDMTCTWRKHSNSSPYLLGRHITLCVWRGREREKEGEKVGKNPRNNKKGQQAPEWGQADTMCRPVLSQEAAEAECVWVDDRWRELSPLKGVRSSGPLYLHGQQRAVLSVPHLTCRWACVHVTAWMLLSSDGQHFKHFNIFNLF